MTTNSDYRCVLSPPRQRIPATLHGVCYECKNGKPRPEPKLRGMVKGYWERRLCPKCGQEKLALVLTDDRALWTRLPYAKK